MEEIIYNMKISGYNLELTYNNLGFCVNLHLVMKYISIVLTIFFLH